MGIQINGNTDTISALDGSWTSDSATHFTGKVSIGGTLTYEDVTNVDAVGIVTAREGVFIRDAKELKIGNTAASPDLTIFHSTSPEASLINNQTGELRIVGSGTIRIGKRHDATGAYAANMIVATPDGSVELHNNNSKKLETSSSGVTVTGTLTATTLTGAITTTDACQVGDLTILNGNPDLRLKDSNHGGNNTEHIITFQDSSGNNQMNIGSPFGEQHLRIKHGTNELVKIQTDGKVGINTTSPDKLLEIHTTNTNTYSSAISNTPNPNTFLTLTNKAGTDGSGSGYYAAMRFSIANGATSSGWLAYHRTGDNKGAFTFKSRVSGSNYPELMRISAEDNGRIGIRNNLVTNFWDNANTLTIGDGGGSVGMTFFTAAAADGSHIAFQESTGNNPEGLISYYQGGYSTTADRDCMVFKTNASEKLRIDSTGHIHVKGSDHAVRFYRDDGARYGAITYTGSNFNIMNPANDHTQITNSGGTAIIKFHHNGNILYGDHMNDRGAELQYEGSQHNMLGLHRNTADHGAASLTFSTSRGTSAGSNTIVQDDDYLGMIRFSGTDGSDLATGAYITGIVDGTPASDKMPSRLGFWTSDANSQSPTEHLRISSNGNITIGSHPGMSATSHARLWIEHTGNNLSSEWDPGDNQGSQAHLTLAGLNNHVRLDMGTMDTSPFAGYIQARYDNTPDTGATDTNDGLEPLQIQPRGGQTYFNFGHSTAYPGQFDGDSPQGGIRIRAGTADNASVSEANTAIKLWPAAERQYSSGRMGDADQGSKYGGIAWLLMDGQSPGKSGWAPYDGNQCWMGMSIHSTPGQELGNWQLRMNSSGTQNSVANNIALQASPQGWVTKPSHPLFLAHHNNGTRITGTGYVTFGDQIEESGGDYYNNSNGRFTAPIGGYYMIFCKVNTWKRIDIQLRINGSTDHSHREIGQFNTSNAVDGWWSYIVQRVFRMEKDEYAQVYVSSLTQQTDPGEWCTFGGYLIG